MNSLVFWKSGAEEAENCNSKPFALQVNVVMAAFASSFTILGVKDDMFRM